MALYIQVDSNSNDTGFVIRNNGGQTIVRKHLKIVNKSIVNPHFIPIKTYFKNKTK